MIKNDVTRFIADRMGVPSNKINLNQTVSELIHDDFDLIDIVMDLESEFDVVLSEGIRFNDLNDIVCSVESAIHSLDVAIA